MISIPDNIKALLNSDSVRKNFRVHFPNGERADITNENIVSESVSFTESICSQSTLKFGLCESPYIEFKTYGVGKIKGATIECSIEVQKTDGTYYSIPLGTFVVDSCKKQADMTHRKIIAYGKNEITDYSFSDCSNALIHFTAAATFTSDIAKRSYSYLKDVELGMFSSLTEVSKSTSNYVFLLMNTSGKYVKLSVFSYSIVLTNKTDLFVIDNNACAKSFDELYEEVCVTKLKEVCESKSIDYNSTWPVTKPQLAHKNFEMLYYTSIDMNASLHEDRNRFAFYPFTGNQYKIMAIPYAYQFQVWENGRGTTVGSVVPFKDSENIKVYSATNDLIGMFTESKKLNKSGSDYYYVNDWNTETAQKYISAIIELQGMFGKNNRNGNFNTISLRNKFFALYPSETLYPANDLYPNQNSGDLLGKANYQTVWYDDDYTLPIGAVECSYKNGTTDSYKKVYADGYDDDTDINTYVTYDLSQNELIKNFSISDANIASILNTFIANASGISYMPSEITMQGRPDLEVGDVLEVQTSDETITTIILQRTMNGIQSLIDNIIST